MEERRKKKTVIQYQQKRLLELLNHARTSIPYYSKVLDKLDINQEESIYKIWNLLPFLTKDILLENKEDLFDRSIKTKQKSSSGGSTGKRTFFYIDENRQDKATGANFFQLSREGINIWDKTAWLWGAFSEEGFISRLKYLLVNERFYSCFDISRDELTKRLNNLSQFNPKIIFGFPSILKMAAEVVNAQKIIFTDLKIVRTGGEPLSTEDKDFISKAFKVPVINSYGNMEFGVIASEESQFKDDFLTLLDDRVYVEIIDEDPATNIGEIVITDLHNEVMPFIRFKTGDLGKILIDENGTRYLSKISGRIYEIIKTPKGRNLTGTFFTIGLKDERVIQFQVIQKSDLLLEIKLVLTQTEDQSVVRDLEERFERLLPEMKVHFIVVPKIKPLPSGKHLFIISQNSPFVVQ